MYVCVCERETDRKTETEGDRKTESRGAGGRRVRKSRRERQGVGVGDWELQKRPEQGPSEQKARSKSDLKAAGRGEEGQRGCR